MIDKKLKILSITFISLLGISLSACLNEEATPELLIPMVYPDDNFDTNVATERQVRTELIELRAALNEAEANAQDSTSTTPADITYPTNLRGITLTSFATNANSWINELERAANSGMPFDLENAPTGEGGILGTRLLDENGLELEQLIEKGSYGAALFNHAVTVLTTVTITPETIDQMVEIFGASPAFPGDDADPNNPDIFAAQYAERRSDHENETGPYYEIRNSLIIAKAALTDGRSEFEQTIISALNSFLLSWEQSNFATVIYYCNEARNKFAQANNEIDPVQKNILLGDAFHAYAEAVGFTYGWLGVPVKFISDEQIQSLLTSLKSAPGLTPTSFEFAQDASTLTSFDSIIDQIQTIYGFSDENVTSFFVNN